MNKKNRMIVCIGMLAAVVAAGTALAGGFASLMDENPHFTPRQVVDWKARADKGDGVAQYFYACARADGWGVAFDSKIAEGYARRALSNGVEAAAFYAGKEFVDRHAKWAQKAADAGDPIAQFQLARCCVRGKGVKADRKLGMDWFRKSAEAGYAPGQCWLGMAYQFGESGVKDFESALTWHEKAMASEFANAYFWKGVLLEDGTGIGKDRKAAIEHYVKAADLGCSFAMSKLGKVYENLSAYLPGEQDDLESAMRWYRKAQAFNVRQAAKDLKRVEERAAAAAAGPNGSD